MYGYWYPRILYVYTSFTDYRSSLCHVTPSIRISDQYCCVQLFTIVSLYMSLKTLVVC